jgi:hypothetical protein
MNEYLVITWADSVPVEDGLAEAARDRGGQLLAAGPVHDASELDSRPAPAGLVIARFSTEETARSWFDAVLGQLDGTTLLAAGATAPVWWPPEKEPQRSQWSRRGELPASRVRPMREIQTSSGPRRSPAPSSPAHPRATGPAR